MMQIADDVISVTSSYLPMTSASHQPAYVRTDDYLESCKGTREDQIDSSSQSLPSNKDLEDL